MRSAYASSSEVCGSRFQSDGTHWLNRDMMCVPSGHRVLSNAVGITPSLNGRTAGFPSPASGEGPAPNSPHGAPPPPPPLCSAHPAPASARRFSDPHPPPPILPPPPPPSLPPPCL